MKKIIVPALMFLTVFFLAGCQSNASSAKDSGKDRESTSQHVQQQLIQKNKSQWNAQVNRAKELKIRSYSETSSYVFPTDLKEMRRYHSQLIKGIVTKYAMLSGFRDDTYTKAIVKVDKVLMGKSKALQGRTIILILHGGLTTDGKSYVHDTDVPLPEIGSSIITPIAYIEYDQDDNSEFTEGIRNNNIKSKTAYIPYDPLASIWVKNSGAKEYILNNENWRNITDPNEALLSRSAITKEINKNYNK